MRFLMVLFSLTVFLNVHAAQADYPKKFAGICKEVGTTRKTNTKVGIDFSSFPNSLKIIDENGVITSAEFEKPTKMSPNVDKYVVLENVSTNQGTQFSLIYYGNLYADGPYFYEMTVSYDLDSNEKLKTHQLQTTYYQGQTSKGNEWVCEYQRY